MFNLFKSKLPYRVTCSYPNTKAMGFIKPTITNTYNVKSLDNIKKQIKSHLEYENIKVDLQNITITSIKD